MINISTTAIHRFQNVSRYYHNLRKGNWGHGEGWAVGAAVHPHLGRPGTALRCQSFWTSEMVHICECTGTRTSRFVPKEWESQSLRETTWWLVAWCIESHSIYIYTHGISILNIYVRLHSIPFYPVQSIQASIKLPYLIWSNLIQLYPVLPLLSFPFLSFHVFSFSYLLSPPFTFSNPIYSPIIYPPIHLSIHQPIKPASQSL